MCRRWFLELYSDYRDGRLDEDTRAAMIAHMAECAPCRRYDRVIRIGVAVLRDSLKEDPEALVDRSDETMHRWPPERGGYSRPVVTGMTASATLLVIALNVLSAWSPRLDRGSPEVEIAPVVAVEPSRPDTPVHFPARPLLHISRVGLEPTSAGNEILFVAFPGRLVHGQAPEPAVAPVDPD